jgi:hypothetical protein
MIIPYRLQYVNEDKSSKAPSMRISRWWPCILPQDLGKYKNFIRYNLAEEQLLAQQNFSDEISYRDLTIHYNEVQMLLNIDTVSVPEPQLSAVKEVEDLTDNFQEITISNAYIYKKKYSQDHIRRLVRQSYRRLYNLSLNIIAEYL